MRGRVWLSAAEPFVLATRSFSDEDGQRVVAGRTRMRASHPVVLANPDAFRAESPSEMARLRSALGIGRKQEKKPAVSLPPRSAASGVPFPEVVAAEPVTLRASAEPRVTIGLSTALAADLRQEARGSRDGLERFGWCYGHLDESSAWRMRQGIVRLSETSVGGEASVPRDFAQLARDRSRLTDTVNLVGFWHTHPAGALEPSEPDLRCFADELAACGLMRFVGLILGPSDQHWNKVRCTAWITRRDDRDRLVCEPARVTGFA